ncbi:Ig-like domain-containing protein [Candidatus Palauibacter sp.]|uniref:Ig-like domain-containing protein n=1 Tax=Candidatus Palauibacter sp. TaxID=3101350 RepID=UPI003D0AB8AF
MTITPAAAQLTALGETIQFSARVRDQNGQVMAGATVNWSSGNTSVATVDGSGLATAVGEGEAEIMAGVVTATGSVAGTSRVTVVSPDRAVLVALYEATGGSDWVANSGWLTDAPLGDWFGVTTDESARVTGLHLSENNLNGSIPAELGGLANLEELVLYANELTGSIPSELGGLANLTELWLDTNQLTGPIPPELGSLANLTELALHTNALTGPIPQSFLQLSRLVALYIAGNSLCVPRAAAFTAWLNGIENHDADQVTACPNPDRAALVALYEATGGPDWVAHSGWLTDAPLGDWFGVTTDESGRVTGLNLSANNLNGSIPAELGSLGNLTTLALHTNGLTGPIPSELGSLGKLTLLWLHANGLTGPIPSELGSLGNLTTLWLHTNGLTGPIPSELGGLANLTGLWLDTNQLTGPIPPELGSLANLTELALHTNGLTGPIPSELGDLANLTTLALDKNQLTGPIPQSLLQLSRLVALYIAGNSLCVPGTAAFTAWLNGIGDHDADQVTVCSAAGQGASLPGHLAARRSNTEASARHSAKPIRRSSVSQSILSSMQASRSRSSASSANPPCSTSESSTATANAPPEACAASPCPIASPATASILPSASAPRSSVSPRSRPR